MSWIFNPFTQTFDWTGSGSSFDPASPGPIGSTTPAAGTFTTLTATGQTSLGGDATNPSLVASAVSGSTRWLQVAGSSVGNVTLSLQGVGNPAFQMIGRGTGAFTFSTNGSSSFEQMRVSHTASAVNYVQVTGAATGSGPTVSAQGSNADIDFNISPKGTNGRIRFGTYTASVLAPTGYIEIKDSGGTTRRLLVG